MKTRTPAKAIKVASWPACTASAPSEAVTLRRSSTVSGAGSEPPLSRFTSSDAEAMVKLPSMMPLPPVIQTVVQPEQFLLAQGAPFAGMGIEPGHHQPGPGLEALAELQQSVELQAHQFRVQARGHARQGDVGRGQQGVEAPGARRWPCGEEHRRLRHPAELRQPFGLSGIAVAGGVPGRLGDGARHQAPSRSVADQPQGLAEPGEAGGTRGGRSQAWRHRLCQRRVQHVQCGGIGQGGLTAPAQVAVGVLQPAPTPHDPHGPALGLRSGEGFQHHFRADARRVSQGNDKGACV